AGKARNMHASKRRKLGISQSRSTLGNVAVMGLLERHRKDDGGTRVRTLVIANRKKRHLEGTVTEHVEQGSNLYTDALLRPHERLRLRPRRDRPCRNLWTDKSTRTGWRTIGRC